MDIDCRKHASSFTVHSQDFSSLLLSNETMKKEVLGIVTEMIYKSFRGAKNHFGLQEPLMVAEGSVSYEEKED